MSPFIVSCLSQFVEGVYVSAGAPSAGGTSGATVGVLAPLMLFHFFQLMAVSVIAGRLAARPLTDAEAREANNNSKPARSQAAKAA